MMKLLMVSFSPSGMPALPVEDHFGALQRALSGQMELVHLKAPAPAELPALITQHNPDAIYWMGHGWPDSQLLMSEAGTNGILPITPKALADLLGAIPGLRAQLLLLGTCFSRLAALTLREVLPCVVGWDGPVLTDHSQAFAIALFTQLAQGRNVSEAYAVAARVVLALQPEGARRFGLEHGPRVRPMDVVLRPALSLAPERTPPPQRAPEEGFCDILLVLDVFKTDPELLNTVRRHIKVPVDVISYSDDPNAPRTEFADLRASQFPWAEMADRIREMVRLYRERCKTANLKVRLFVAGQAPHAAWVTLGHLLSRWVSNIVFVHRDANATEWQIMRLNPSAEGPDYFTHIEGGDVTRWKTSGQRAGLYLHGLVPPPDAMGVRRSIARHMTNNEDGWCDILWMANTTGARMTQANLDRITQSILDELGRLAVQAARLEELVLYLAAPAPMAFLVGWAINPNQIPKLTLTHFERPNYTTVLTLPLSRNSPPSLNSGQKAIDERSKIRWAFAKVLDRLKAQLNAADLALSVPLGETGRAARASGKDLHEKLQLLSIDPPDPDASGFKIDSLNGRITLGEDLLEGFRFIDPTLREPQMELFLLHELFHDHQDLVSETYMGIGRAAVVLGELDDAADAYALRVLMEKRLRRGGEDAATNCGDDLRRYLDAVLAGLCAFDRMSQGARILDLPDRRLRRYLRWAVQRVRAESVRTPAQVPPLLDERLMVELAPFNTRLDSRGDRLVLDLKPEAQLFVVVRRRLLRISASPAFQPADLLNAVRGLDMSALLQALQPAVVQERGQLCP